MARRATGWLDAGFHAMFRETMVHAAVREKLFCPIYTLMPDHLHFVWVGLTDESDQRLATRFFRGNLARQLKPYSWQHQPYDHVLRDEERMKKAFANTANYIACNPVGAKLTTDPSLWPYTGCVVPGYPDLNPSREDFWSVFWRLHRAAVVRGALGKLPLNEDAPAV